MVSLAGGGGGNRPPFLPQASKKKVKVTINNARNINGFSVNK
jgi:hypothetical protein